MTQSCMIRTHNVLSSTSCATAWCLLCGMYRRCLKSHPRFAACYAFASTPPPMGHNPSPQGEAQRVGSACRGGDVGAGLDSRTSVPKTRTNPDHPPPSRPAPNFAAGLTPAGAHLKKVMQSNSKRSRGLSSLKSTKEIVPKPTRAS